MSINNNRFNLYYIYLITNKIDGRTYVGKRKCPKNKTPETDKYMGSGIDLVPDQEKLGIENFSKDILAICHSLEEENILEKIYIKLYKDVGKAEYNRSIGGDGGYTGDESYRKIGLKQKKCWENPEYRKRQSESHKGISPANKGVPMTPEQYERFLQGMAKRKTKPVSEEWRKNHSEFMKTFWNSGKMNRKSIKGRKYSLEEYEHHKEGWKRSAEKSKGKPTWNKGKHGVYSAETLRKMSESRKGKPFPGDASKKSSEITRGSKWWNNGSENKRSKICPGEDWVLGRLSWKK